MRLILMIAAALVAAPAGAETVADACKKAAAYYYSVDEIYARNIQSFPELNPPRARMVVATQPFDDSAVSAISVRGTISCKFTQSTKPFGLTEFCPPDGCFFMSEERLEELQVLMQREGY